MFAIPAWALGVGVIIFCIPAAIVLLRIVHPLLPPPPSAGRQGDTSQTGPMLEEMQARLADMDQLKARVDELEERVDFAERLLASKEAHRLASPQE